MSEKPLDEESAFALFVARAAGLFIGLAFVWVFVVLIDAAMRAWW